MHTRTSLFILAMVALGGASSGCAQALAWRPAPGADGYVHTLTNLHPDEARAVLYSDNFQQPGLIPVCTPVVIERITSRAAVFVVPSTGRRYTYRLETRRLTEPPEYHLARYFGPECDTAALNTLYPADHQGIRDGRVYAGMSKRGVIFALGWPPAHGTPNPDGDVWRYWRSRMDTFEIYFQGGQVTYVRE